MQVKSVAQRLVLARRQVGHTRLTAPVARAIAAVRAEVNENVSPGQPVVVLAAGAAPEVDFAVPEALIARVREGMRAAVVFDAIPSERFDAVVTEVGVTTTAVGTTFPVTVRLDAGAPEIRSGMAAAVDMVFEEEQASSRFDLPGHAVGEDREGRFVFVAAPTEDGLAIVRRRPLTVGAFAAGGLEVTAGIDDGDQVVTAGANANRPAGRRHGSARDGWRSLTMDLTRAAIEKNRITAVLLSIVLAGGASAYRTMSQAEDAGFAVRAAQVLTRFPGASPERIEQAGHRPHRGDHPGASADRLHHVHVEDRRVHRHGQRA